MDALNVDVINDEKVAVDEDTRGAPIVIFPVKFDVPPTLKFPVVVIFDMINFHYYKYKKPHF
jgi:hypothetical protein